MAPTTTGEELEPNNKERPSWVLTAQAALSAEPQLTLPNCEWLQKHASMAQGWLEWSRGRASLIGSKGGTLYSMKWVCPECKVVGNSWGNWNVSERYKECERLKNAHRLTKKYISAFQKARHMAGMRARMITLTLPGSSGLRLERHGATVEAAKKELMRLFTNLRKSEIWNEKVKGYLWAFECTIRDADLPMDSWNQHRTPVGDWCSRNRILNPHLHVLVVGDYWPWAELVEHVESYGFGRIVDIRAMNSEKGVRYACKEAVYYVSKNQLDGRGRGTGGMVKELAAVIEKIRLGKRYECPVKSIPTWLWNPRNWDGSRWS